MREVVNIEETTEKIHALDKELAVERAERKHEVMYIEKARGIQAAEYERRLHALNGEAQRLRDIQATYVPREVFEGFQKDITREITELKEYKNTAQGRQTIIAVIIPILISLGFLIINYILR